MARHGMLRQHAQSGVIQVPEKKCPLQCGDLVDDHGHIIAGSVRELKAGGDRKNTISGCTTDET
jgi:hypothetical protein